MLNLLKCGWVIRRWTCSISLGVLPIKINDDYGFISKNLFIDFITDILIRLIALILYFIAKIFLGFKITGKENLIKNRGVVTVSNHIHYIDCVLIGLITFPRKTYFSTLEENFKIPFIIHIIKLLHGVPIPKSKNGKENFYHDVINELNNNIVVQLYSEASLWPYYEKIRDLKEITETMMKEKINENIDIIL